MKKTTTLYNAAEHAFKAFHLPRQEKWIKSEAKRATGAAATNVPVNDIEPLGLTHRPDALMSQSLVPLFLRVNRKQTQESSRLTRPCHRTLNKQSSETTQRHYLSESIRSLSQIRGPKLGSRTRPEH